MTGVLAAPGLIIATSLSEALASGKRPRPTGGAAAAGAGLKSCGEPGPTTIDDEPAAGEGPGPPYPSPPDSRTDSIFLPPRFWKPRSVDVAVSVVAVVWPEWGRSLRKKGARPAAAKGVLLERSAMGVVGAEGLVLGGASSLSGGWRRERRGLWRRRQRKRMRMRMARMVMPATPPTTPPTTVEVGGAVVWGGELLLVVIAGEEGEELGLLGSVGLPGRPIGMTVSEGLVDRFEVMEGLADVAVAEARPEEMERSAVLERVDVSRVLAVRDAVRDAVMGILE